MKKCENCNKEHNSEYGSGRFCSSNCARSFSTKNKRSDINEKVSLKLKKNSNEIKKCLNCGILLVNKRKKVKCCSKKCSAKYRWKDDEYRNKTINDIRIRCEDINEKLRLKEIGRKGGFGKKGYTENGVYFESNFEKKCFEFLDDNLIKFTPHKAIPNSSKVSDIYLDELNIWVELDGIDRDKRKKWLGENYDYWLEKLNIYKTENLEFYIIKNFDEFKRFIKDRDMV